jgi:2-polyprenyl-3-methyl-5-hydroxy-6-metoxy-1,4-benzoquinol methylase
MFSFSVLDGIVVKIVTDALGVYYIASILIVTMVLFVLRFMAYQKVVFINKNERSQINGIISPLLQKIRINQAKRFMKGNSFLDVGSSLGEIIRILPKKAIYVGIEGNKDFFINAKNKNPNHKFINLYLNKNNVKNLKIKEKFDTIFALAVVEHMNDPEQIISGLKKYLKPEGRIIITTPSKWSELILNLGSKLGIFMEEMGEHKKQFTKEEIIKLGISAGYSIEHYKSFELGMNHLLVLKKK